MIKKWGKRTSIALYGKRYYPLTDPQSCGNISANTALMFAQLWQEPSSKFYHNKDIKDYAIAHFKASAADQEAQGTGEINYTFLFPHPDGTYSAFHLSSWLLFEHFFRYEDGTPVLPSVRYNIEWAEPWELKYNVEPWVKYKSRYNHCGGTEQSKRAMAMYDMSKRGLVQLDDWQDYYTNVKFTPATNRQYDTSYPAYDPRGTSEPTEEEYFGHHWAWIRGLWNNIVMDVPEEWWLVSFNSWWKTNNSINR